MEILLNIVVIIVALAVLYGIWGGVHLFAVKRLGFRKLGCRGPSIDEYGNSICCTSGDKCDKVPPKSEDTCRSM